jgi:hypothetical protein
LGSNRGIVVIFLAVLLVFGSYVSAKNQMVTKREAVTSSWGEVNNQLQRRADLIPNLVETVKGYAKQETTVFGDIANARAGLLNAHGDPKATIQANGQLDGALGRLLALTENYPDLKSNGTFSVFRRAGRHGKPDQRGQNALQQEHSGLQHLYRAVSQQHLGGHGRIPTEQRLLPGESRGSDRAQGQLLGRGS